jgi:hypothetical protein
MCAAEVPQLREVRPGHWSACHFAESLLEGTPPIPGVEEPSPEATAPR